MKPYFFYIFGAAILGIIIYFLWRLLKKFLASGKSYNKNPNGTPLTGMQYKAILVSAINGEHMSAYIDTLAMGIEKAQLHANLKEWWGIYNRKDALNILDWLLQEGHRYYFDRLYPLYMRYDPKEWDTQIAASFNDMNQAKKYLKNIEEAVKEFRDPKLLDMQQADFDKGIIGFDAVRLTTVARMSYDCGLINEQEAWQYIMAGYQQVKEQFSDWQQLSDSYMIGRYMWNGSNMALYSMKAIIIDNLHRDTESPWAQTMLR